MRGQQTMMHCGAPCGGQQTGKQRTDEGAGFGGNAHVDDFQTQGVGDHADGRGDQTHTLRGVEHYGESPYADEREHHA